MFAHFLNFVRLSQTRIFSTSLHIFTNSNQSTKVKQWPHAVIDCLFISTFLKLLSTRRLLAQLSSLTELPLLLNNFHTYSKPTKSCPNLINFFTLTRFIHGLDHRTGGFDLFLNLAVFLSRNKDPYRDDVKLIQPFCTYISLCQALAVRAEELKNERAKNSPRGFHATFLDPALFLLTRYCSFFYFRYS